jgi:hypothetical protein
MVNLDLLHSQRLNPGSNFCNGSLPVALGLLISCECSLFSYSYSYSCSYSRAGLKSGNGRGTAEFPTLSWVVTLMCRATHELAILRVTQ